MNSRLLPAASLATSTTDPALFYLLHPCSRLLGGEVKEPPLLASIFFFRGAPERPLCAQLRRVRWMLDVAVRPRVRRILVDIFRP
jgi:hypothetical protein